MSGCKCDITDVLSWDGKTLTVHGNLQVNDDITAKKSLQVTADITALQNINMETSKTRFNYGGGFIEAGKSPFINAASVTTTTGITFKNYPLQLRPAGGSGVFLGCQLTKDGRSNCVTQPPQK